VPRVRYSFLVTLHRAEAISANAARRKSASLHVFGRRERTGSGRLSTLDLERGMFDPEAVMQLFADFYRWNRARSGHDRDGQARRALELRSPDMSTSETKADFRSAIEACVICAAACEECAAADIRHGSPEMVDCALACLDCAAICQLTAAVMQRASARHARFCQLCAQICRECAEHCARHADHHDHCRRCLEACEACATACAAHAVEIAA
jgi:hypothetical protein